MHLAASTTSLAALTDGPKLPRSSQSGLEALTGLGGFGSAGYKDRRGASLGAAACILPCAVDLIP